MILVLLYSVPAFAKDFPFDISITGSLTYQGATWESGMWENPTGNLSKYKLGFAPSIQIKYNRWKFQPTLEFSYQSLDFDFSNREQTTATFETSRWRLLGGITCDFGFLSAYLLGGGTYARHKASLVEKLDYPMKYHGSANFDKFYPVINLGAYKTWPVWIFRVGPEISVMYEFSGEWVRRCRNIDLRPLAYNAGIRAQW